MRGTLFQALLQPIQAGRMTEYGTELLKRQLNGESQCSESEGDERECEGKQSARLDSDGLAGGHVWGSLLGIDNGWTCIADAATGICKHTHACITLLSLSYML
jgi:hypothetical protein